MTLGSLIALGICALSMLWGVRFCKTEELLCRDTTTALRGIAILVIMTHHLSCAMEHPGLIYPFKGFGYLGTAVFLFLSGYGLMTQSQSMGRGYLNKFWIKRVSGTYFPVFLAVLLWAASLRGLGFATNAEFMQVLWKPVGHWYLQMLTVWYLAFFLIVFLVPKRNWQVAVLFAVAVCLYVYCSTQGYFKTYYDTILCFPCGAAWAIYHKRLQAWLQSHWIQVGAAGALCTGILCAYNFQRTDPLAVFARCMSSVVVLMPLLALLCVIRIGKNRFALFMGKISLQIFILHNMLQDKFVAPIGYGWQGVTVYYAGAIVVAIVAYEANVYIQNAVRKRKLIEDET